jgi:Regulator of ribonuclease activity B
MIKREDFPRDDDGEVLYQLAVSGVNLAQKRIIDFSCYAKDCATAKDISDDLVTYGYKPRIYVDDGEGGTGNVSVYAAIFMLPDYELLLAEQQRLNAILRFHKTSCDGWVTQS